MYNFTESNDSNITLASADSNAIMPQTQKLLLTFQPLPEVPEEINSLFHVMFLFIYLLSNHQIIQL